MKIIKDWVEEAARNDELEGYGGDADFFNQLLADLRLRRTLL